MSHSDDKEATMVTVMQKAAAAATVWGSEFRERCGDRAREERGQTAAEYMGILLVVGVIIAAVATSGIGEDIVNAIKGIITDITGGTDPRGGGGAPQGNPQAE
jgi:pilus assembly protein Flp/PilA